MTFTRLCNDTLLLSFVLIFWAVTGGFAQQPGNEDVIDNVPTNTVIQLEQVDEDSDEFTGFVSFPTLAPNPNLAILPHDARIGQLQSPVPRDRIEDETYRLTDEFVQAIINNEIDRDKINPSSLFLIERRLLIAMDSENEQPISGYRIGAINAITREAAHASLRFISDVGRSEGEIYLIRIDDNWYVDDIQINILDLSIPYQPAPIIIDYYLGVVQN